MKDTELYARLLGLASPWQVTDVTFLPQQRSVTVKVAADEGAQWCCPQCGHPSPGYDKRTREWRHLDTMQFKTLLEAEVPRVQCPEHGVLQVKVPWAEAGSGFTALFEAMAVFWLKQASTKAVASALGLSWNAVDGIMQRAVRRGLARRGELQPERLSIDETSFQKRHEYVTVVTDQATGHVIHVADDRTTASVESFYSSLTEAQRAGIEAVAMDMWPAYIKATRAQVPEADTKIAFDKFHVAKYLGDGVDKVRRQEHRHLLGEGDATLRGSRYQWLRNPRNMSEAQANHFATLRDSHLKTARAWAMKEMAMDIWRYQARSWAVKAWQRWFAWAQRCRLAPMKKVAATLKAHLWGILNAMSLGVHNGHAESNNARIQRIKARACGFRNRERFRHAIYFHCGGLNLMPDGIDQTWLPT
jgi:transposase